MRRRRLVVVAVVAIAAAWWLSAGRLSPEERRLVGAWYAAKNGNGDPETVEFRADRRVWTRVPGGDAVELGRWSVRGQELVVDFELHPIRRAIRPVATAVRVHVQRVEAYRLAWATPDEISTQRYGGRSITWTRAPAD